MAGQLRDGDRQGEQPAGLCPSLMRQSLRVGPLDADEPAAEHQPYFDLLRSYALWTNLDELFHVDRQGQTEESDEMLLEQRCLWMDAHVASEGGIVDDVFEQEVGPDVDGERGRDRTNGANEFGEGKGGEFRLRSRDSF
jgi:hypothetical protein